MPKRIGRMMKTVYYCPVCLEHEEKVWTNHGKHEIYMQSCPICGYSIFYPQGRDFSNGVEARIHGYYFNLDLYPEQEEEYSFLKIAMKQKGYQVYNKTFWNITESQWVGIIRREVDTVQVVKPDAFDNQFITSRGRLFQWFESRYPNEKIKEGYWLEFI